MFPPPARAPRHKRRPSLVFDFHREAFGTFAQWFVTNYFAVMTAKKTLDMSSAAPSTGGGDRRGRTSTPLRLHSAGVAPNSNRWTSWCHRTAADNRCRSAYFWNRLWFIAQQTEQFAFPASFSNRQRGLIGLLNLWNTIIIFLKVNADTIYFSKSFFFSWFCQDMISNLSLMFGSCMWFKMRSLAKCCVVN